MFFSQVLMRIKTVRLRLLLVVTDNQDHRYRQLNNF